MLTSHFGYTPGHTLSLVTGFSVHVRGKCKSPYVPSLSSTMKVHGVLLKTSTGTVRQGRRVRKPSEGEQWVLSWAKSLVLQLKIFIPDERICFLKSSNENTKLVDLNQRNLNILLFLLWQLLQCNLLSKASPINFTFTQAIIAPTENYMKDLKAASWCWHYGIGMIPDLDLC